MKRILIAGTGSGCGKTTVTLALLAALETQGRCVAACKCGPDYIDPMFHRAVLGIPGRNLDPFFSTGEQLREQLRGVCADVALLEGVMGYYDGLGGSTSCSSYTVAAATETPVVLVVNARGMSASVGALLRGFRAYRESSGIVGVIFNRVSRAMCPTLTALAREEGLACIGCLPDTPQIAVESRHLGLVTAQELPELRAKIDALGAMAHEFLDCELLLSLAADAPSAPSPPPPAPRVQLAGAP
ncbi:MAG: AAA family ATPase, partial [Firmicutes bacterium]|nr:AAA family ATPase [Bacillota bacterium]